MNSVWHNISGRDINNVPKQRIFHNSLDDIIQDVCKDVLKASVFRTDGHKNDEVAIIIDINGNKLGTFYGYNGVIKTDTEEYLDITIGASSRTIILIHNHHNNSVLSYNDLIE